MLGAAVIGVLLIACANVAALLLGRGVARRSEVAIRTALGAGRSRVARQLMTEAVVLFGIGGVAGTLLGWLSLRWLVALAPPQLEMLQDVSLDPGMILFTISLSLVTGLVFGVVPSWAATRGNVAEVLTGVVKGSSRAVLSNRFRTVLVVAQVATASLVLSVAALLLESLVRLQHVDLGFEPGSVLTVRLDLPKARYPEWADRTRFVEQLLAKVRSLPAVASTGAGSSVLLGEMPVSSNFTIEGRDRDYPLLTRDAVTVDFFRTLEIPLIRGRLFTPDDRASTLQVALINETAARRYWKGANPIGSRFTYGSAAADSTWLTVVGVVADTRRAGPDREPFAEAYLPHPQYPLGHGGITLVARIAGPAEPVLAGIRSPSTSWIAISRSRRSPSSTTCSTPRLAAPRFNAWLLSSFAIAAVALTIVGTVRPSGLPGHPPTARTRGQARPRRDGRSDTEARGPARAVDHGGRSGRRPGRRLARRRLDPARPPGSRDGRAATVPPRRGRGRSRNAGRDGHAGAPCHARGPGHHASSRVTTCRPQAPRHLSRAGCREASRRRLEPDRSAMRKR